MLASAGVLPDQGNAMDSGFYGKALVKEIGACTQAIC